MAVAKEKKVEKYELTELAKQDRYFGVIGGFSFLIIPAVYIRTTQGVSKVKDLVCYKVPVNILRNDSQLNDDFIEALGEYKTGNCFEELTDEQKHILIQAKVIKLSQSQSKLYHDYLTKK
jgi:hypothetical protein